jgi:hypothetical protein
MESARTKARWFIGSGILVFGLGVFLAGPCANPFGIYLEFVSLVLLAIGIGLPLGRLWKTIYRRIRAATHL